MFRRSHSRRAPWAMSAPLSHRRSRLTRSLAMESLEHRHMLAADQFELNDTVATATVLGSSPYILAQNLSIDIPNDVDFFRIVAHHTGQLVINTYFTHAVGDIDVQALDSSGDNITPVGQGNSVDDDERIIIPVVAQQTYLVRVFGANGATNTYNLEIENYAAPAPTGVQLAPTSDTGESNSDGVTSDTTPTFFIQTDVLEFVDVNKDGVAGAGELTVLTAAAATVGLIDGVAVEVTLVNVTAGTSTTVFADPVIAATPELYTFTPAAPLAAGTYFVSARLRIFDNREVLGIPIPATGRSTASPPLGITIIIPLPDAGAGVTADMINASDSGMVNTDNVTNKMSPAFNGVAPVGFKVRLYANGELVGQTTAGSDTSDVGIGGVAGSGGAPDDGLGVWEITSEPLVDGAYDITLEIEDDAGNVTEVNPIFNPAAVLTDIVIDTLEPNTPLLDLLDDTGRHDNDNITRDTTPLVSMTTLDPNIALAQLLFSDNLKFRIFDRFQGGAEEVLIYDSAVDPVTDAFLTPLDGFTAHQQLTRTLPFLTPVSPAIVGGVLAAGVHNLKLEVEDRAGNFSHDFLLEITVDPIVPPVSFGLPDAASVIDGLAATSDSGVGTLPALFADRVTTTSVPRLWGQAEADSIVRVYLDRNNNGVIDLLTDTFLGQTVAVPLDGNAADPDGYWELTSVLDLNEIPGLPKDGVRRLLVTAEDVAGNPISPGDQISLGVDELQIFLDTQGPQVTGVTVNELTAAEYDVFDPKPTTTGPTPLVNSLRIGIQDLPLRVNAAGVINDFLLAALQSDVAIAPGNYLLVGDHVGVIPIQRISVVNDPTTGGNPATARIDLVFFSPLPDDRYTLTVRDNLVDLAGNRLDGDSNAAQPLEDPLFATGDGIPGGNFVARFTIDSRPEIASYIPQQINIDINGNFVWDPSNAQIGNDATNVDLTFLMGVAAGAAGATAPGGFGVHDLVFAGKFFNVVPGAEAPLRLFDQLAVFGNAQDLGVFRWLIDRNSDGIVNPAHGDVLSTQPVGGLPGNFNVQSAIPVAGNFDGNANNGDEIGLYNAGRWALDSNRNFVIDAGDAFITNGLLGHPIVGNFDGDGLDDLATFNNNVFSFDLRNNGFGAADATLVWGFPGVLDRPVAADMDQDGIDDIGLWVPRNNAQDPVSTAEWYFLVSGDRVPTDGINDRLAGSIRTLNHPFDTTPFGRDLYAEFGNELALPLVGNFDPPVTSRVTTPLPSTTSAPGDFNNDGQVDGDDLLVWQRKAVVSSAELAEWRGHFVQPVVAAAVVAGIAPAVAASIEAVPPVASPVATPVAAPAAVVDAVVADAVFATTYSRSRSHRALVATTNIVSDPVPAAIEAAPVARRRSVRFRR